MLKAAKDQAYKLVILQAVIGMILFGLWWIFRDFKAGYSALLGSLACIIPNYYFIRRLFKNKKRTPANIIRDFYFAEVVKLFSSAVLLIFFIKFTSAMLAPIATGYIVTYFAVFLFPFLLL